MGLGKNPFASVLASEAALRSAEAKYNRAAQVRAVAGQTLIQTGKTLITLPSTEAEVLVNVSFYNTYTDEPSFTFGSVLLPGQVATSGSYPTISGTVTSWTTTTGSDPSVIDGYTGANVVFVASGTTGLQMYCTYTFIGTGVMIASVVSTSGTGTA